MKQTIFLCGPSGGGKTTLANALADKLGYHAVGSLTRIGYALNGVKNQAEALNLDPVEQVYFQQDLLVTYKRFVETYLRCKSDNVGLVFERSLFDHLPYAFPKLLDGDEESNSLAKAHIDGGDNGIFWNDVVVYVPAPPKDWEFNDGFRVATKDSGARDSATKRLFDEYEGNKLVLTSHDLEDRVQEVLKYIRLKDEEI